MIFNDYIFHEDAPNKTGDPAIDTFNQFNYDMSGEKEEDDKTPDTKTNNTGNDTPAPNNGAGDTQQTTQTTPTANNDTAQTAPPAANNNAPTTSDNTGDDFDTVNAPQNNTAASPDTNDVDTNGDDFTINTDDLNADTSGGENNDQTNTGNTNTTGDNNDIGDIGGGLDTTDNTGDAGTETQGDNATGGDDTGSDLNNSTGGTDNTSDSNDNTDSDIKAKERELYDSLSPEEQKMRVTALKKQFVEMYNNCNNIIDKLNTISGNIDTINPQIKRTMSVLFELKEMIDDYFNNLFDSKTYIENDIMFNRYLSILNSIKNITEDIDKITEND